jgi:hypothetical protein
MPSTNHGRSSAITPTGDIHLICPFRVYLSGDSRDEVAVGHTTMYYSNRSFNDRNLC